MLGQGQVGLTIFHIHFKKFLWKVYTFNKNVSSLASVYLVPGKFKNYSQLMWVTCFDTFFTVHFFQALHDFLVWSPVFEHAGCHQRFLLVFVPNTMWKCPKYHDSRYCSLFLWIWFCDIKIANGKAIFNLFPSRKT